MKRSFFLIFAFALVFFSANSTVVNCVRQFDGSYTCQLTTLLFGKFAIRERQLEDVNGIVIRTFERHKKPHYKTYRAEFSTNSGDQIPLEDYRVNSVNFDHVQETVEIIDSQMLSGAALINYRINRTWSEYLALGTFVLILLYASFKSPGKKNQ